MPEQNSYLVGAGVEGWEGFDRPALNYPVMGIRDDEFSTVKKLITKEEVRSVTLGKLQLQDDLVMWDIGAGSGSVSIEAGNLMPNGRIFALEKNPNCVRCLKDNVKKFKALNVHLIEACAPKGLEDLPDPDRVFIGGSSGMLEEIIKVAGRRLKHEGCIVINAVTLDTLTKSVQVLEDHGYAVEITCINISKTRNLTEYKMFSAHNPVYVIAARKEEK